MKKIPAGLKVKSPVKAGQKGATDAVGNTLGGVTGGTGLSGGLV